MKSLYLICSLIILVAPLSAQDTLAFQGFEATASDTWSYTETPAAFVPNSDGDYWGVVSSLGSISPPGNGGSSMWGIEDLTNNNGGAGEGDISLSSVNTTGYSNFVVSFDYHVDGFDNGDDIDAQVTVDGVAQPIEIVVDGSSNFSTNGWETYTFNWNAPASTIGLDIIIDQNGNGDQGAIDNITLTGVQAAGCLISSISIENQSSCNDNGSPSDNTDDYYTANFVVNFINKPGSGTLDLSGDIASVQSVSVASTNTTTSHTFTGVQFSASGASGNVTASFSADAGCNRTEIGLIPALSSCSGGTEFLIFSEYIESGNQKYLEIHNPTLSPISLGTYQILIYNNGATSPNATIPLTGASIAAGGYYVIENTAATTPPGLTPDQTTALGFNGNDAIILSDGGIVRDAIGQIGNTPAGGSWSSGSCDTEDQTLRKDSGLGISTADTNPNDAYDPAVHWQFCLSSIVYSNLGVGFVFPVELISFDAIPGPNETILSWSTASEQQNLGFELFRLEGPGPDQKQLLGFVQGGGTSQTMMEYSFADLLPHVGPTVYQLYQIDFDGTSTLIGMTEVNTTTRDHHQVRLFPNPSHQSITVTMIGQEGTTGRLWVSGIHGQTIKESPISIHAGNNEFTLDVSGIPAGIYNLHLYADGKTSAHSFIKL